MNKYDKIIMWENIRRENKRGLKKLKKVKLSTYAKGFVELEQDLLFRLYIEYKGDKYKIEMLVPKTFIYNVASVPDLALGVTGGRYNPEYIAPTGFHDWGFERGLNRAKVWKNGKRIKFNESIRKERKTAHMLIDLGFKQLLRKNHTGKTRSWIMRRAVSSIFGKLKYRKCWKIRKSLFKAGKIPASYV